MQGWKRQGRGFEATRPQGGWLPHLKSSEVRGAALKCWM